jgi:hypothetical protein
MPQQQAVIDAVTAALATDNGVAGLFLGGSYGKRTEDAWSDVDFVVAVIEGADVAAIALSCRGALEGVAPVVHWNQLPGKPVFNAVLADWTRADFTILMIDDVAMRLRPYTRILFDPAEIASRMAAEVVHPGPNRGRIEYTINEFIRVIGLCGVGAGREEWVLMVTGVHLLRGLLTSLMIEELGLADPGGALHLSRVLPPEDLAALAALPVPAPRRETIAAAHLAAARVFFPRAKPLAEKLGIVWPSGFEDAARWQVAAFAKVSPAEGW